MANKRIVGKPFLVLFLVTSFFLSLTLSTNIAIIYLALFLLLLALNLQATIYSRTFTNSFPLILLATLPTSIINFFSYGEYRYFLYSSFLPVGFTIALLFRKDQALLRKSLLVCIFILQAIMIFHLFRNNFSPGYSYEQIIDGVSSNGYTSILVILLSFYLINTANWSFYDLAISVASLYLCIYGYSRGSVIACIAIIFAFFIHGLRRSQLELISKIKISKKLLLLVLSCAILLVTFLCLFAILSVDFSLLIETYTKFRIDSVDNTGIFASLRDAEREAILLDYFKNLDPFSIIFGNDSPYLYFHKNLNGNPHNSFLNSHRLFGLSYIAVTLFLIAKINPYSKLSNLAPETSLLIIAVFVRILSEPYLFGSPLDVLLFSTMVTENKMFLNSTSSLASQTSK